MSGVKNCRNYSYSIKYHIVWCIKDGLELINSEQDALTKILTKIASDNNIGLLETIVEKNHVHVIVDCSPQSKIPNVLKAFKGVSGRLLLKNCPDIKERLGGESLWKSKNFIATPSEDINVLIEKYLIKQGIRRAGDWIR